MQNAARTDKGCMPNVITYSALITAFVAGGRLDKAYEIFLSMRSSNVRPDHICYSTLIAGMLCNLHQNSQTLLCISHDLQDARHQPTHKHSCC